MSASHGLSRSGRPSVLNGVRISIDLNSTKYRDNSPVHRLPTEALTFKLDKESLREALRQQLRRAIRDLEENHVIQLDLSMQLSSAIEKNIREQALRQEAEQVFYKQLSQMPQMHPKDFLIGPFHPSPGQGPSLPQASAKDQISLAEAEAKFLRLTSEVQRSAKEGINASKDMRKVSKKRNQSDVSRESRSSTTRNKILVPQRDALAEAKTPKKADERENRSKKTAYAWKFKTRTPPSSDSQYERFGETRSERARRKRRIKEKRALRNEQSRPDPSDNTLSDIESITDFPPPPKPSESKSSKKDRVIYATLDELMPIKTAKASSPKSEQMKGSGRASSVGKRYFTKEYQELQELAENVEFSATSPTSSLPKSDKSRSKKSTNS
ncbi:unnamed protein product [Bursaphelenchus xylophilus]|uniref:(pine wood nematode) hypothetical protein n=1 Tax=Bursaphelenchus xylophilus TaxID=6326 RepID=A0A7I8WX67_BURXY|nr:unnamed protein product [Bursaphelenchus xylophilus]CAG9100116.1 unnamed protein product [Bursaphelenchus xylophilus]